MTPVTRLLIGAARDHGPDAPARQDAPHARVAVAPVPYEARGPHARAAAALAAHAADCQERLDDQRFVALAAREHERHRFAAAFGAHVHLGAEAATGASERLLLLATRRAGSVLMRPDDGAVDVVRLPDACGRPAPE